MSDPLARFRTDLADIAEGYARLAAQHHAVATGKGGVHVGGSKEPPVPVALDPLDLTAAARHGSLLVADLSPWPGDQIGHLAVATELDFWACDIADILGDPKPVPVVPVLAMWLRERAGWAWDYYGAVDEMAVKVGRLARTMHAMLNPRQAKAEPKAAPCPGCATPSMLGDGQWVRCPMPDCGRVLSEAEYLAWSRLVLIREALGGDGISAREVAIRYNRAMGTVHWLAHKHQWARTRDGHRPVLYLVEQVRETMMAIEAAKAEEAKVSPNV